MNKFKFYFILLCAAVTLFSCGGGDDSHIAPPRDYAVQYVADTTAINEYLKNYHIEITNAAGNTDQDVVFTKKDDTHPSIWDMYRHNDNTNNLYPKLLYKNVTIDNATTNTITYKVYYLKLRPDYADGKSPSKVDRILTSYNGSYLSYESSTVDGVTVKTLEDTQFEYIQYPENFTRLDLTIKGWSEIFPLFKSGTTETSEGPNPVNYSNFGAGVIFIPSGLAYFNFLSGSIPAYAPLVFSFKLYDVALADQDGDGIYSNDEDLNHDGNFTTVADDTDGDGIMDYLDVDDDGDGAFTKTEILIPGTGPGTSHPAAYYPYNGAAVDDPATTYIDETQGIPRKFTGPIDPVTHLATPLPADFTDPTRLRRHLDKTARPPFQ